MFLFNDILHYTHSFNVYARQQNRQMSEGWINFYSVSFVIALVFLVGVMYYVYGLMEYQNAAMPWPPTTASCPDGWRLDAAGWCQIPAVEACPRAPATAAGTETTGMWYTVGSLPSAWTNTRHVCAANTGSIHSTNTQAAYTALTGLVPAVHMEDSAKPGTFTNVGITPTHFRDGKVAIDFREASLEARRKFCDTYGILWDGVTADLGRAQ